MRYSIMLAYLVFTPSIGNADSLHQLFGAGVYSCATWTKEINIDMLISGWILGYWSGMNDFASGNTMVGQSTDGFGILGEVKLECSEHPSESVRDATSKMYVKLRRSGT